MILSLFTGFILGAAAIVFALQNVDVVELTFLGWQFESSLALLVLVSVTVGVLISMLASLPSLISYNMRIMGLKRENRKLADELSAKQQTIEDLARQDVVITPVLDVRNA